MKQCKLPNLDNDLLPTVSMVSFTIGMIYCKAVLL